MAIALFRRALVSLSLFFLVTTLQARDFYVDAAKGNDSNDGLASTQAFQTFGHASLFLLPGDSLTVASGNYVLTEGTGLVRHANGQAVITVKAADPSHPPQIHLPKGENEHRPPSGTAFNIETSNVVIDSIDIDGGTDGFYISGNLSNITIRHCQITDSYQSGIMMQGQKGHETGHVTIENCQVSGCGRINLDRSGKRDWPHSVLGLYTNDVTISHCAVHDNFGEGLGPYFGCRDWKILDNTVYDNWSVNIYLDTDLGHLDVERNFIYCTYHNDPAIERNCPDGIRVANERRPGSDPNPAVEDVRIVNNIICGGETGIRCSSYGYNYVGQGMKGGVIANNTIISQTAHPSQNAIKLGAGDAPNLDVVVINNLAYSSTKTGSNFEIVGPGITASNNYFLDSPGFLKGNVDWSQHNPPLAADYQLTAQSSCAHGGTVKDAPTTDFEQAPRGNPPSVGAYELRENN